MNNEQDINILTYFKINNNINNESEYILYNYKDSLNTVYISLVFHEDDKIKLIKPIPEMLQELKMIMQNLISNNPNSFVFSKNKYQYIDIGILKQKQIEKEAAQKIQLSDVQYNNLISNNFLMYPYSNLSKSRTLEGFKGKYSAVLDTLSIVVSSILLLLLFGGLIAYQFNLGNLINNLTDFDYTLIKLLSFDLKIDNVLLIKLGILSFTFSIVSYKSDSSHPILMWFILTLLFIIIYFIWFKTNYSLLSSSDYVNFLRTFGICSVFISLVFTISYWLTKELATLITNSLSFCNYISFYTIFYILFSIMFIGLGLFYYNYVFDYISEFILLTL